MAAPITETMIVLNQKWIMWGLLLPLYFFGFFHRTSTSTVAVDLARELTLSGTIAGLLSAAFFYVYGAMQLPAGLMADTVGPRKLASAGGVIMGAATIAFAFSHSLLYATLTRAGIGLGASLIFVSLMRIQVNWFEQREFPLITGLTVCIGTLGALVGVGPFAALTRIFSWRSGYMLFGVLSIIAAIAVFFLLKNNPASPVTPRPTSGSFSLKSALHSVLSNRRNYFTFIAFGLGIGGYMTFASLWGVPFLMQTCGLSAIVSSTYITFLPLGVVIGSLLNGMMSTVFGSSRRAFIALFIGAAAVWAVLAFIRIPPEMTGAYPVVLFILGFMVSAVSLVYTTVRENNAEWVSGTALAFTNIGGFLSIALLQPISGWILDRSVDLQTGSSIITSYPYHGFRSVLILFLILHLIALGAFCFSGKGRT